MDVQRIAYVSVNGWLDVVPRCREVLVCAVLWSILPSPAGFYLLRPAAYASPSPQPRRPWGGVSSAHMADFGPELEDGERYLPAGILLGEDGWGAGGNQQGDRLSRCQSSFPDRVGGFVCYRPELGRHGLASAELTAVATTTAGRSQKPRADLSAAYLQQWFWKGSPRVPVAVGVVSSGCVCGGDGFSPAPGRIILAPSNYAVCSLVSCSFPPIRSCRAQVEIDAMRVMKRPIQARLFPTMESGAGRECGGTGFFLPLYRFQSDSRRSQGRKCDGDGQKQKLYAVVAKKGMPLQPHTEVGLPPEWTY